MDEVKVLGGCYGFGFVFDKVKDLGRCYDLGIVVQGRF